MRAYVLRKHGPPRVLRLVDLPDPEPGPGEVRVAVRAVGINYADILSRRGLYGWAPKLPYVPGMEACGVIDTVGSGVDPERVGERVIVCAQTGAYAEKIVSPQALAVPAVARYSSEENAAFAVNYMTAWIGLFELARLNPRDRVLVQAAAGGVGTAAVQLAKATGCPVAGVAGGEEKAAVLTRLGVDLAVDHKGTDFQTAVRRWSPTAGVDVVMELVGGTVYRKSLALLNPFGRLLVMGFADLDLQKWNPLSWYRTWRSIPRIRLARMGTTSIGVMSSHLGHLIGKPDTLLTVWNRLVAFTKAHDIRPLVGSVFPFEEMAAAHRTMESRRSVGKIVIRMG